MKYLYCIIGMILLLHHAMAGQGAIGKVKLWQSEDQAMTFKSVQNEMPTVLIFLSTTCPICQKYIGMLPELSQQYASVQFVGVFTKWESWEDIQQFSKEYQLDLALLLDKKNRLLRRLQATTTPEVFLLDKNGKILYRGAIDNWFYGLGKYRPKTTEHYLTDALDAFLQGKEIAIKKTEPIGCVVEQ